MKRSLLFLTLALLLAGGGVAGWWFLVRQAPADDATAAAQPETTAPTYVEIDRLTVPVVRGDRVRHHMAFLIVLELKSEDDEVAGADVAAAALEELKEINANRRVISRALRA